ncbi:MAG TPA: hypothetical protein VME66_16465 [Candidatus Acidoferrales bacterium]|nr:hypothetical protein [Candidatus Acidoferrales bacterium]
MDFIFLLLFYFGVGYLFAPRAMMRRSTRRVLGILLGLLFGAVTSVPGFVHDICMVGTVIANVVFVAFGLLDCIWLRVEGARLVTA